MEEGLVTLACVLKQQRRFPLHLLKWFLKRVKTHLSRSEFADALLFHVALFRVKVPVFYQYPFHGVMLELRLAVDTYEDYGNNIDAIVSAISGFWGYGVNPCRFAKCYRWRRIVCMDDDARVLAEGTFVLARSESLMKMRERVGIKYGLRPRKKYKTNK